MTATVRHLAPPAVRRLTYSPPLDGLRGLSVAAVLCFHQGFPWARGGFLGVSAFFTLSGFLVTGVFLATANRDPVERLTAFWARRARRLWPAAWLTIVLVVVAAAFGTDLAGFAPADPLAALAHLANWRFVEADQSYAELFTSPSPFLHFWSLAIEEQFYLLLPLGLLLASRSHHNRVRAVALVLACIVASTLWMTVLGPGDRSYYGTDARAAEFLVGVLGGLIVLDQRFRPSGGLRRVVGTVGTLSLIGMMGLWTTATLSSSSLTRGGFLLHGCLTLLVIGAALVRGPVREVLSARPLVWLGRVSYGVYLFHWPIFLLVDADLTGLSGLSLFAVRCALTFVVAAASFVLLESPVLSGHRSVAWLTRAPVVAFTGAALVFVSVTVPRVDDSVGLEEARRLIATDPEAVTARSAVEAAAFDGALPASDAVETSPEPAASGDPFRVTVLGDSTAMFVGAGLLGWAEEHRDRMSSVAVEIWFGCTVLRSSTIHYRGRQPTSGAPECQDRDRVWPEVVAQSDPDLVVVMVGPHDVADHDFADGSGLVNVGQPDVDLRLILELEGATRLLLEQDVGVVWITAPQIDVGKDEVPPIEERASDDARIDRFNELLSETVDRLAAEGEPVALVDLETYMAGAPGGPEDSDLRPDGVHFTFGTAALVAHAWLGDQVASAGDRVLAGR